MHEKKPNNNFSIITNESFPRLLFRTLFSIVLSVFIFLDNPLFCITSYKSKLAYTLVFMQTIIEYKFNNLYRIDVAWRFYIHDIYWPCLTDCDDAAIRFPTQVSEDTHHRQFIMRHLQWIYWIIFLFSCYKIGHSYIPIRTRIIACKYRKTFYHAVRAVHFRSRIE